MTDKESIVDQLESSIIGEGNPPVLFLHGWGGDLHSLDVISKPVSRHRRIISLSLPGFGRSPDPGRSWGTWEYVDAVKDWLDNSGFHQVDIVAHSFGGRIAIGLAAQYKEAVNRLILIASTGLKPHRNMRIRFRLFKARAYGFLSRCLGSKLSGWVRKRREQLGSDDWRNASPVMRSVLGRTINENLQVEMELIKAPTMLIFGSEDKDTVPESGENMGKHISGSEFILVPGAGHYCFLDEKGTVLSAVWRHLELPTAW